MNLLLNCSGCGWTGESQLVCCPKCQHCLDIVHLPKPKVVDLTALDKLNPAEWFVYFLVSTVSSKSYVGMTCDVRRRLRQHNGEIVGGAKYTKSGRPWVIKMVLGPYKDRVEGCRVEWRAKRFRGHERFVYRRWVAELDDQAPDKDRHLHFYRGKKVKKK